MGTVHDWSATEAVKAAKDRHAQILRGHHGAPISDGQTLIVLCACGALLAYRVGSAPDSHGRKGHPTTVGGNPLITKILDYIKSEPVLTMGTISAALALGLSFGLNVNSQQEGAILALAAAVLSLVVRQKVTPVA